MVSFSSRISLLIFCLDDLSIGDRGVLKSLTIAVLESMCAFKCFSVCLMKLGELTLKCQHILVIDTGLELAHLANKNTKSS
jgi:hypothetical protein